MGATHRGVNYGKGEVQIEADALPPSAEQLKALVREVFSAPGYEPPMLPASSLHVRRLSGLGSVDFADVVSVLETDPMLAANAMRMAHSQARPGQRPPPTLGAAVDQMGLKNISNLAFSVAFKARVFCADGYCDVLERVRQHSVATAKVARLIANGTAVADYAFTCGLLHDIGMSAILIALAERKIRLAPALLSGALETLHEEAGAMLVRSWGLSADVERSMISHHRPTTREGALVRVAEVIAVECGFGVGSLGGAERGDRQSLVAACKRLRLDQLRYEQVRTQARAMLGAQ